MAKAAVRRNVIRVWMSLPSDSRQTKAQAAAFARKAAQQHTLPRSRRDPYSTIMGWLFPRTGKP
jgi:hypothetical protein